MDPLSTQNMQKLHFSLMIIWTVIGFFPLLKNYKTTVSSYILGKKSTTIS